MRTELIILLVLLAVTGGAFALEGLGPQAARLVGIGFCLFLVSLMVLGLVMRRSMKSGKELTPKTTSAGQQPPPGQADVAPPRAP